MIVAFGILGLLAFSRLGPSNARVESGIHRKFVQDMEPVDLYPRGLGGGTHLQIPMAYMQWSTDRRGESEWQVTLTAVYPEMTPYALLDDEGRDALESNTGSGEALHYRQLLHIYGAAPGAHERLLKHEIAWRTTVNLGEHNGFNLYRQKSARLYYDILVPLDRPDSRVRYFQCASMTEAQLPQADSWQNCSGKLQVNDRLSIDYIIPRRELAQWESVEERVERLIGSFVVDCFDHDGIKEGEDPAQFYECRESVGGR
jgi:hypothetical protein